MKTATAERDTTTPQHIRWFNKLRNASIRIRLLIAFVLLVLIPAGIIILSAVLLGFQHGQQRVINQLYSVVILKDEQIAAWIESLQLHLTSVIYPHQVSHLVEPLLQNSPDTPAYQHAYGELRIQFEQMLATTDLFEEVLLLDRDGRVLLSTRHDHEGQVHATQLYFWRGLQQPSIQSLASATSQGRSSPVVVSRPVYDQDGKAHAVLVGRASSQRLNDIMLQRAGLGETGETYLVGTNFLVLTDSRFEDGANQVVRLQTNPIETVVRTRSTRAGLYRNYRGRPVVGVYHWLPALHMVLVAEQEQNEAFLSTYLILIVNIAIAVVATLIALFAAHFTAHSIAVPLADLAHIATRIADGDLKLTVPVQSQDEVGMLAAAFNRMTARLRQVIDNLEQNVRELQRAEANIRRINAYLLRDVAEQSALNHLNHTLQDCQSLDEAYTRIIPRLQDLFVGQTGALYRCTPTTPRLELVGWWRQPAGDVLQTLPAACPALQSGRRFTLTRDQHAPGDCQTCPIYAKRPILCVQLQTGGELFGLLHLRIGRIDIETLHNQLLPLVIRTTDLLALALSNLHLREHLHEQAIRDPLTGLFNRRFLYTTTAKMIQDMHHQHSTLGLLLLDIDHFKHINDIYGHDAGDAVCRAVGNVLRAQSRRDDIPCRWGGEEFLVILPHAGHQDTCDRADMLRQAIAALKIYHDGTVLPPITVSIGLAVFPDHGRTFTALNTAADQALYHAKHSGRNRVCMAGLITKEAS